MHALERRFNLFDLYTKLVYDLQAIFFSHQFQGFLLELPSKKSTVSLIENQSARSQICVPIVFAFLGSPDQISHARLWWAT